MPARKARVRADSTGQDHGLQELILGRDSACGREQEGHAMDTSSGLRAKLQPSKIL